MRNSILIYSFFLLETSIAGYVLQDDYNPSTFLDMFNAFSGADPTSGFVKLVDMPTGRSTGLISNTSNAVTLRVDSTNVTPNGRPSMRLESKKTYNTALIIADIAHMPGGICGTWPAFWTLGPNWPQGGEIDIIEGVNSNSANSMTLHTAAGCSINSNGAFSGKLKTSNCDTNAPGQGSNAGCGIAAPANSATYGSAFNKAGGGIYAMEWTAQSISVHFFPRNAIPADIKSGSPVPSGWSKPLAQFSGQCNFQSTFKQQSIIIDTTFCGQWAGDKSVWQSDSVCSAKAATCEDYVKNNPSAFVDAYWQFNSVKVYSLGGSGSGSGSPSALPPAPPAVSSAVPVGSSPSAVAPIAISPAPVGSSPSALPPPPPPPAGSPVIVNPPSVAPPAPPAASSQVPVGSSPSAVPPIAVSPAPVGVSPSAVPPAPPAVGSSPAIVGSNPSVLPPAPPAAVGAPPSVAVPNFPSLGALMPGLGIFLPPTGATFNPIETNLALVTTSSLMPHPSVMTFKKLTRLEICRSPIDLSFQASGPGQGNHRVQVRFYQEDGTEES